MKRFLLASVMAMTVTATPLTAHADEPAPPTTSTPPTTAAAPPASAAPTSAAPTTAAAPIPAPVAYRAPPVATTPAHAPVVIAAAPAAPAATSVTPAAAPVPAAPAPVDAAALGVRPTPAKPLALAPASEGLGLGYKLLAIAVIGGAVALYMKKKRGAVAGTVVTSKIDILAKSGIGVRSQLIVVEVEGTRLLVGMTPNTIQTLAVLQTPEDDGEAALARAEAVEQRPQIEMIRPANLGDRVRSLLGADEPIMPRLSAVKPAPASKPRARTAPARAKMEPRESREVAGQARGLLLSSDEDT